MFGKIRINTRLDRGRPRYQRCTGTRWSPPVDSGIHRELPILRMIFYLFDILSFIGNIKWDHGSHFKSSLVLVIILFTFSKWNQIALADKNHLLHKQYKGYLFEVKIMLRKYLKTFS